MLSPIERLEKAYCPLSENCINELMQFSDIKTYPKNTILVREGEYSDKLFFILEGCARAYYNKDGKLISDWFAFEDDFICAIVSFFLKVPSPHYIETCETSTVLEFSGPDVETMCERHHDFERLARLSTTKTMLQLQQRVVSLQFETAQQRLENLLNIRPDIMERIRLGDIASFLGMTQETLSRLRAART